MAREKYSGCAYGVRAVCMRCAVGCPLIGCVRNKGPIMWGTVRKLMKPGVFVRESASEYIIICNQFRFQIL